MDVSLKIKYIYEQECKKLDDLDEKIKLCESDDDIMELLNTFEDYTSTILEDYNYMYDDITSLSTIKKELKSYLIANIDE